MVPDVSMSCLQERYASPRTEPDNSSLNLQMLFRFNNVVQREDFKFNNVVQREDFKWSVSIFEAK